MSPKGTRHPTADSGKCIVLDATAPAAKIHADHVRNFAGSSRDSRSCCAVLWSLRIDNLALWHD